MGGGQRRPKQALPPGTSSSLERSQGTGDGVGVRSTLQRPGKDCSQEKGEAPRPWHEKESPLWSPLHQARTSAWRKPRLTAAPPRLLLPLLLAGFPDQSLPWCCSLFCSFQIALSGPSILTDAHTCPSTQAEGLETQSWRSSHSNSRGEEFALDLRGPQ